MSTTTRAALMQELIEAIEKRTATYDPVTSFGRPPYESLKRADGSDMSEDAAKYVLPIIARVMADAWDEGFNEAFDIYPKAITSPIDLRDNPYRDKESL